MIEEDGKVRIQPCVSPVWDTAIAMIALADAGVAGDHPALRPTPSAGSWSKEVRTLGDWCVRRPGVEPRRLALPVPATNFTPTSTTRRWSSSPCTGPPWPTTPRSSPAPDARSHWLLAMQNKDGGWAAFDVDVDNEVLTKVPFADHNAMLDPSCADITARIIEILGLLGYRRDHPQVARGLDYLWRTQEPEGCWYGRWGVNYIYGTWQVLQGLQGARTIRWTDPALRQGGRLARIGPASRRRLGRDLRQLRRPRPNGPRRSRPPRRPPGRCSA